MSSQSANFISKAFQITKDNIILAQPLVLFLVIFSITLASVAKQTDQMMHYALLLANFLLCTAFLAGWLFMVKKTIMHTAKEYENEEERTTASFALIKQFFPGVGDYFLQITFTTLIYFIIYALVLFLSFEGGVQFLPNPNIDFHKFMAISGSTTVEIQKFVSTFTFEQLKAINLWMLYLGGISAIYSFLTMYWFPAVFDKNESPFLAPFKAFNRAIVFVFKNFFGALGILIFLMFLHFVLSILSLLFNMNPILSIIGLVISFYFATYAIVLLFLYYEAKK